MRKPSKCTRTPTFSPNFQTSNYQSESASNQSNHCELCESHLEDIAILQQRLTETHHKLMNEIDTSNSQKLQMLKLAKQNLQLKEELAEHRKAPGKITMYHDHPDNLLETNNKLKNDLQAMRNKVLVEMTRSNQIRDDFQAKESKYQTQILQLKNRLQKVELMRNRVLSENEEILQENNRLKSQYKGKGRCECGFQEKFNQVDEAFMNQRVLTKQLIDENNSLKQQIFAMKTHDEENNRRIPGRMKTNAPLINISEQIHDHSNKPQASNKSRSAKQKKKGNGFQETKDLISRLEAEERTIRKKY